MLHRRSRRTKFLRHKTMSILSVKSPYFLLLTQNCLGKVPTWRLGAKGKLTLYQIVFLCIFQFAGVFPSLQIKWKCTSELFITRLCSRFIVTSLNTRRFAKITPMSIILWTIFPSRCLINLNDLFQKYYCITSLEDWPWQLFYI